MFKNIGKALGLNSQKREIERISAIVDQINHLESEIEKLEDAQLEGKTSEFRRRLKNGETLDDVLVEAFAVIREASKRTIGLRHFNVQMIGGIALHEGKIAEMRTGEGKTLVATLPLYLNALAGKGVHLVTVNDYLARRDAKWMAPIFTLMGLSVGVLQMSKSGSTTKNAYMVDLSVQSKWEKEDKLRAASRKEAYAADITYGTNNEFGFDYLRDNLIINIRNRAQRGHFYAIIDEVDNILIDEARTPLIISGKASEDVGWYQKMAVVAKKIKNANADEKRKSNADEDIYFDFNEKDRSIALTELGEILAEDLLQAPLRNPDRPEDITPQQARLLGYLEQALRAEFMFIKGKDYIIDRKQAVIVDEFTGRLMRGRRWSGGLHQAVEAKEGVTVNPENITHATITLQNYFRKYEKLSGMSGTALSEAEEFSTIYGLDVLELPTNLDFEASQPQSPLEIHEAKDSEGYVYTYYSGKDDPQHKPAYWKRKDYPDVIYRTVEAKLRAICLEIFKIHIIGRPILIGTTSVEKSEELASRLVPRSIRQLLTVILIQEKWLKKNNIRNVEFDIPELSTLNLPLGKLDMPTLRQFAESVGVMPINLDQPENVQTLLAFFNLGEDYHDQLLSVIKGGVHHKVLNATKEAEESELFFQAGALGSVIIATQMAGRGVDIKLGGELRETTLTIIRDLLQKAGVDPFDMTIHDMASAVQELGIGGIYDQEKDVVTDFLKYEKEMQRVREAGGLHVIGSERNEARRVDNQIRGRSGRQGDPGSSRYYISLEDDLMRLLAGDRVENVMRTFNFSYSIPIEQRMITNMVDQAQVSMEGRNFDVRKHLLEYDDVLNDQREKIYADRDLALVKRDLSEDIWGMFEGEFQQRIDRLSEDAAGVMRLISFLGQIQPTVYYKKQAITVPSFTLSQIVQYAQKKISSQTDPEAIKDVFIDIAGEAREAEKKYLEKIVADIFHQGINSFEQQLKERLDLVDIFIDSIEYGSEQTTGEISAQFKQSLQLKGALDEGMMTAILQRQPSALDYLTKAIERSLKKVYLTRILRTIEHRLNSSFKTDIDKLLDADWKSIEDALIKSMQDGYQSSVNFRSNPNHPIIQKISQILNRQLKSGNGIIDITNLLREIAVGTQTAINQKTHQQGFRQVQYLKYQYMAADLIKDLDPTELSASVIAHLKETTERQKTVWGIQEIMSIIENRLEFKGLPAGYRGEIEKHLEPSVIKALYEHPLSLLINNLAEERSAETKTDNQNSSIQNEFDNISLEQRETIIQAFGQKVQRENYRQVMLRAISRLWIEHLTNMEALRVSVSLESYAQRDPLVEYKNTATDAFKLLLSNIRMAVVSGMFRLQFAYTKPTAQKKKGKSKGKSRKRHGKKR